MLPIKLNIHIQPHITSATMRAIKPISRCFFSPSFVMPPNSKAVLYGLPKKYIAAAPATANIIVTGIETAILFVKTLMLPSAGCNKGTFTSDRTIATALLTACISMGHAMLPVFIKTYAHTAPKKN